jgi:hypothetical protein
MRVRDGTADLPPLNDFNMAITLIPSQQPFDEAEFRRRLADEYKILQEKIDKIGGFRFTIKGWSVTAVIAASAAGSASKSLLTVITISVGLAFMLWFFFRFELEQVRLSRLFGERARTLEETFRNLDRNKGTTTRAPIVVPYTAHEIGQAKYKGKQRLLAEQASRGSFQIAALRSRWVRWWHVLEQAHIYFYLMLIVLSFCPLLPHYQAIHAGLKQLGNRSHNHVPAALRLPCAPSGVPEC